MFLQNIIKHCTLTKKHIFNPSFSISNWSHGEKVSQKSVSNCSRHKFHKVCRCIERERMSNPGHSSYFWRNTWILMGPFLCIISLKTFEDFQDLQTQCNELRRPLIIGHHEGNLGDFYKGSSIRMGGSVTLLPCDPHGRGDEDRTRSKGQQWAYCLGLAWYGLTAREWY